MHMIRICRFLFFHFVKLQLCVNPCKCITPLRLFYFLGCFPTTAYSCYSSALFAIFVKAGDDYFLTSFHSHSRGNVYLSFDLTTAPPQHKISVLQLNLYSSSPLIWESRHTRQFLRNQSWLLQFHFVYGKIGISSRRLLRKGAKGQVKCLSGLAVLNGGGRAGHCQTLGRVRQARKRGRKEWREQYCMVFVTLGNNSLAHGSLVHPFRQEWAHSLVFRWECRRCHISIANRG